MSMTFQQCKDRVLEDQLGLTWDDWMLHYELPKGNLVAQYEQMAADMYVEAKNASLACEVSLLKELLNKVNTHYNELLSAVEAHNWSLEQQAMQVKEPTELDIKAAATRWFSETPSGYIPDIWAAAIKWYKSKIQPKT